MRGEKDIIKVNDEDFTIEEVVEDHRLLGEILFINLRNVRNHNIEMIALRKMDSEWKNSQCDSENLAKLLNHPKIRLHVFYN